MKWGKIIFFIVFAVFTWIIGSHLWGDFFFDRNLIENFQGVLDTEDIYQDIAVEFHGMIFDIILFGIILSFYESIREKKDKIRRKEKGKSDRIQRYREEIEDYLEWNEPEVSFRIAGNIRRLNRLNITDIKLERAFLRGINLQWMNLRGANLKGANLQGANLDQTIIRNATLQRANLNNSNLDCTEFDHSDLQEAKLRGTNLKGTLFLNTNLKKVDFRDLSLDTSTTIDHTAFSEATLHGAKAYKFQKEEFKKVMTESQIESMIWEDNPDWHKPVSENNSPSLFQKNQCSATATRTGKPCRIKTKPGHDLCHIHFRTPKA